MSRNLKNVLLFISLIVVSACNLEKVDDSNLEYYFKNPPNEVKPRTWMHAMSGNMSKEGLTKDLESIAEVGIGGLLLFNVTQGIPNGPIIYNSSEHHKMIQHAAKEAERLGLSFGVHNCDGWSSSGGPWVTPEESMKMVVWSETIVNGGTIDIQLPEPSKREGFYKDIAVIAYPSLASEINDSRNKPIITASDKTLDISLVSDGKIDDESQLKKMGNQDPWVQFSYDSPKTVQSAKLIFNDRHATAMLQVSNDGKTFKDVRELFKVRTGKGEWAINDHFEPITAKFFRLKFNQAVTIKEVQLTSNYFINNPLGRTVIARTEDAQLDAIGTPDPKMILNKKDIKDFTKAMDKNGVLQTTLPEGTWTILRFGYTSTGAFNNPASEAGRGLEVDKLNRKAFKSFFDGFVQKVIDSVKPIAPNALQYIEIDSYEMGGQNWTDDFASIFTSNKDYDILSFLPLIAGRFVESPEASEAVLSDYRDVISNLMTENYFAYFTELCHEAGLKSYIEPYGFGPLNDLDVGGKTDIPMGEFWMNRPITQTASAVSSAHIYGKPVISAESFTSTPEINWKGHPAMAKTSGDLAWTYGINEFMFHRFAHQANPHVEPGMTMNRWGFHFDRTQTWWKNAGAAWFKYIARGSYMLRQGNPVSDLLVYIGEGTPNGSYYRNDFNPEIPKTINFDNLNTDVLINRLELEDNKLLLPEGTAYKMLLLKNTKVISLAILKRILEIANSGIPVIGDVPQKLTGYNQSESDRKEFSVLQSKLAFIMEKASDWNTILKNNRIIPDLEVNNGEMIDYAHRKTENEDIYFFFNADTNAIKTFDISFRIANKIPEIWNPMTGKITKKADFINEAGITKTRIKLNAGESTFVVFREASNNLEAVTKSQENFDFSFTGANNITAMVSKNGEYAIPLSSGKTWKARVSDIPKPLQIHGSWGVTFSKQSGYGGTVKFDSLVDWKDYPKDSINHYSGTANYSKTISIPDAFIKKDIKTILDLGMVFIVADVTINGKHVAVSWMPPFNLDITNYLKAGDNQLEIAITNQWSNRLIGDERYPANDGGYKLEGYRPTGKMPQWFVNNEPRPKGERTTFTTAPFYDKNSPLMPSGLIGPVQIKFKKVIKY
jgi:hypothetical protein